MVDPHFDTSFRPHVFVNKRWLSEPGPPPGSAAAINMFFRVEWIRDTFHLVQPSSCSIGSISAALSGPVFVPPRGDKRGLIFPNSGW